jgi:hypothetical protein
MTSVSGTNSGALFRTAPRRLDEVFEGLADFIDVHFTPDALLNLIGTGETSMGV